MKAYLITEAEMRQLKDRLELCYRQRINQTGEKSNLMGSPSYEAYRSINFEVCRWISDMGGDHYSLKPELPEATNV